MAQPIALAVFPSRVEALPGLLHALGGPGRPAGVSDAHLCDGGGIIVEWDPAQTAVRLVIGLIDIELRRYGATRRIELLRPLPLDQLTEIASQELHAKIGPDQVLEALLGQAGFPC